VADGTVNGPWRARANRRYARIGFGGSSGTTPIIAAIPFALPRLDSIEDLDGAALHLTLIDVQSPSSRLEFAVDLYGLGLRQSPLLQPDDFHVGGIDPQATIIARGVLKSTTKPGEVVIRSDELTRHLRALYDAEGRPLAPFALFRLNPDRRITGTYGYLVGFQEDASTTIAPPRLVLRRDITELN
jgi:hypothetical protein